MSFSCAELEFVATEELIEIVPNFVLEALPMLGGTYGPFRAQVPTRVPLWLGLELQRSARCRIQPPEWMDPDRIEELIRFETQEQASFGQVPAFFIEISTLLLKQWTWFFLLVLTFSVLPVTFPMPDWSKPSLQSWRVYALIRFGKAFVGSMLLSILYASIT